MAANKGGALVVAMLCGPRPLPADEEPGPPLLPLLGIEALECEFNVAGSLDKRCDGSHALR